MVRTIKLSYTTVPQAIEIIAQWRKAQSVVIRTAYNRVREGKKDKEILDLLRTMPQGKLDSWLTLSGLKRSRALHLASPHKAVIFGGKHNLQLRSQGKITAEEWKAKRLLPLLLRGACQELWRTRRQLSLRVGHRAQYRLVLSEGQSGSAASDKIGQKV